MKRGCICVNYQLYRKGYSVLLIKELSGLNECKEARNPW